MDGSIESRMETDILGRPGQTSTTVEICNQAGNWRLFEDRALRLDFFPAAQRDPHGGVPFINVRSTDGEAFVEISDFHGESCYCIVTPFRNQSEQFGDTLDGLRSNQRLKIQYPTGTVSEESRTEDYFGAKDLLPRGIKILADNGSVVSEVVYSEISTNIALSESLFRIDTNLNIVVVTTPIEYAREVASQIRKSLGLRNPEPIKNGKVVIYAFIARR